MESKISEKSVELQVAEELEAASRAAAGAAETWEQKAKHLKTLGAQKVPSGRAAIAFLEGFATGCNAAADDLARRADALLARSPAPVEGQTPK